MSNSLIQPSHVAILVPSVRLSAEFLKPYGFIGPEEDFEGEGTREIYVGLAGQSNLLLLMQPAGPGAYQRALEKRGPGLHHLAIDVLSLDNFLESLSGSGWLLHPTSVKTIKNSRTAYLARPGFPGLVEVQEKKKLNSQPLFVQKVGLPFAASLEGLMTHIGLDHVVKSQHAPATLVVADKSILMKDLIGH